MTTLAARQLRRVLVALDPAAQCRAALETAARLAAEREAELVGIFVEEADLLQAAALPVTQVIRDTDFMLDALDPSKMQQGLRAWAAQARAALDAVAARWHVQASFRVIRGSVGEALLAEADGYELIALGTVSRASQRRRFGGTARLIARAAPCAVLLMRGVQQPGEAVVVLYEGSEQALALGRELADLNGQPLSVLAPGEALAEAARAWLAERGPDAKVEVLAETAAAPLAARLGRAAAGIVVLERKGKLGGQIDVEAVLAGPASSIVLVG
ncbi:MAG: universal stress protein [Kiloniellales bacterium]